MSSPQKRRMSEMDPARAKKSAGRPRQLTREKVEEAARLRAEGLQWEAIGQRLGLKAETCRRALWAVKKAGRAVGNPPNAVNNSGWEG
jgi:hypothetical protein